MIDPAAAKSLKTLFTAAADCSPYLIKEAEILFKNAAGTKCHFKAKTPIETANLLQHILNNENGMFNRELDSGEIEPLNFRMNKRVRLKSDNKEFCLLAFNFSFRESDKPGVLWLSDPEMNGYHWQGDEKIENKPPFSCNTPNLHRLVEILRKAGEDWAKVDFTPKGHNKAAHLKLVKG